MTNVPSYGRVGVLSGQSCPLTNVDDSASIHGRELSHAENNRKSVPIQEGLEQLLCMASLPRRGNTRAQKRRTSVMHCYFCDAPLQQVGPIDICCKKSEIALAFACPQCGKRYQTQLIPIAIFVYTPGQEATLLRLDQCSRCKQLYRHESRHVCQVALPEDCC